MIYFRNMDICRRITPTKFSGLLKVFGWEEGKENQYIKNFHYRKNGKNITVSVPKDTCSPIYMDQVEMALLRVGEAEGLSVFDLLSRLLDCLKVVDADSLLKAVGDRKIAGKELEELLEKNTKAMGFDDWNPWPQTMPPVNTKLRATLECKPHIRKCRDVLYLDKEPEKYTRIKFSEPGWYMIQTGEKIDNQKIKAWRIEKPYQK